MTTDRTVQPQPMTPGEYAFFERRINFDELDYEDRMHVTNRLYNFTPNKNRSTCRACDAFLFHERCSDYDAP